MKIKWLGHSCFMITGANGTTLITDPYDSEPYGDTLTYARVDEEADVVTLSHHHADHGNAAAIRGEPIIVSTPGPHQAAGFLINGTVAFHDTQAGALRGEIIAFSVDDGELTVCHLGDLGHELEASQAEAIGAVDILLIPVGGFFTIDAAAATRVWQQLSPAITIPMHFRNDKCHFQIDTVEPFLAGKPDVEHPGISEITISQENLPRKPKIIVLEPAN